MCGICGIISIDAPNPTKRDLAPMLAAIAHRGPDGEGAWVSDVAALGHRRLSIIDIEGGAQPMTNKSQDVAVIFNGEIYNHHELRRFLISKGHTFTTRCDTEVLVHLWEEKGPEMVDALSGMFAFAIWDKKTRQLFCARDRLGEKPFFYTAIDGCLVFASEIKGILSLGQNRFHINRNAIDSYLATLHTIGDQTAIKEIHRLLPGHTLLYQNGSISINRYWSPPIGNRKQMTVAQWEEAIREEVDRAAGSQIEADVPLGIFLSGGLDSSAVAAAASKHASKSLNTYSIEFDEPDDETVYAKRMAEHIGANHTLLRSGIDLENMLWDLQKIYDEPYGDSAAIPMIELCRNARKHVKVVLGGDGGDEIFGGYPRYLATAPLFNRMHSFSETLRKFVRKGIRFFGTDKTLASVDFHNPYLHVFGQPCIPAAIRKSLMGWPNAATAPTPHEVLLQDRFDAIQANYDLGDCCAAYDINAYLPDDLLVKVDIAAMSVGLELRSPMLDYRLVELALQMPSDVRLYQGQLKGLFRKAVGPWLEKSVRNRTDKKGLGAPVTSWMKSPVLKQMLQELVLPKGTVLEGILDMNKGRKFLAEVGTNSYDGAYAHWQLLCLALWRKAYPQVGL